MATNYQDRLTAASSLLGALADEIDDEFDDNLTEKEAEWRDRLVAILKDVTSTAREARDTNADAIDELLEKAEEVLNLGIVFAYVGELDPDSRDEEDRHLFTSLPSFTETPENPLLKYPTKEGVFCRPLPSL